jgi:hypothetical protein
MTPPNEDIRWRRYGTELIGLKGGLTYLSCRSVVLWFGDLLQDMPAWIPDRDHFNEVALDQTSISGRDLWAQDRKWLESELRAHCFIPAVAYALSHEVMATIELAFEIEEKVYFST